VKDRNRDSVMGTLYQLMALPACFLLLGLMRGGCRHLVASFVRRIAVLMGADDAARVELMKRSSRGAACGSVDSGQRRDGVAARELGRGRCAAPGPSGGLRSSSVRDAVLMASGIDVQSRNAAARPGILRLSAITGTARRGRSFAMRSAIGSR
jgi:hypothetical protein